MTHQDPVLNFILHTMEAYHVPVQSVQADPRAAAPDVGVYADIIQSQRLKSLIFRFIDSLEPGRLYFVHDIFSREIGTSLTNYVTARRVELAQSLLSFTDLPIKTVAECCGFSNIQYFSKLLRKYTAQSPKRYRQDYYLTEPDHAADNVQS